MMTKQLWDFLDNRGDNVIEAWGSAQSKRDRGMLNQRFDRLTQVDFDLALGSKLLAGPIYKHVYKMQIHGDVQMRPMLCKGPLKNDDEYTLLLGAAERNWKLVPASAKTDAEHNRGLVLASPLTRRKAHERIPK
jgi:hypothetical protein